MKITVIGATGMVGMCVMAEGVRRGYDMTAASRSRRHHAGAISDVVVHLEDTGAVVRAIDQADATVIAVPPDRCGESHEPFIEAHRNILRAAPKGRFLVVGCAGSLEMDGVLLKDMPDFPPVHFAEAQTFTTVLDLYRASQGMNWSMISPAPMVAPGGRSGTYRLGRDQPVGDIISSEDLAMAILDELESPRHANMRFTVAR